MGLLSLVSIFPATSNAVTLPALKKVSNAQTMPLLQNAPRYEVKGLAVVDNALSPVNDDTAPLAEVKPAALISTYVVREGDTFAGIAKMFDVSVNTLLWSNGLTSKSKLKVGQNLVILPITGVSHTVKKGDTVQSIAKKYKADPDEIRSYNGMEADDTLAVGDKIIVPDGELSVVSTPTTAAASGPAHAYLPSLGSVSMTDDSGYFIRPVVGGVRTRGIHGSNGVDLANKLGSPIYAAAEGTVMVARSSGWNGGYGEYIVVSHPNGLQTLYGHLSQVLVNVGDKVGQGEVIAKMGSTGNSTGSHLHFEVRGGKNPF